MRRLILMRHAKSSWADPGQRDLDRPLNKRGRRAAALIGGWLKKKGYRPDQALVSSARRTQETWAGIVARGGAAPRRATSPSSTTPGPRPCSRCARPPDVALLLVLGHQPGIGAFAAALLAEPPEDPDFDKYPTAATAVIDFDVADLGGGRLGRRPAGRIAEATKTSGWSGIPVADVADLVHALLAHRLDGAGAAGVQHGEDDARRRRRSRRWRPGGRGRCRPGRRRRSSGTWRPGWCGRRPW